MSKREFTGVFIPAHIWNSTELIPAEKMILGEIDCLSKSNGYCDASRKHFAEWLNCTVQNITYYFEKLERLGFISIEKVPGYRSKIRLCNSRFYENIGVNGIYQGGKRDLPGGVNGIYQGGKRDLPEIKDKDNLKIKDEIDKADKPPKPSKPKVEKKEKQPPAVIHRMVEVFEKEHQTHFKDSTGAWVGFTWQKKEFGALSSLKSEFEKRLQRRGAEYSDDAIVQGWQTFLEMAAKADKFIVQKWFTPTKIWSNFQGIINSITAHNGKATSTNQQQPSKAERQRAAFERIVRDATENGLRGRTNFGATFSDTVPNQGI